MKNKSDRMNGLANENSPYLLQHANNPVHWHPWGVDAFEKAKSENKPIFLSIGYSTCHWCHVMAYQSFEDQEVADLLNTHFVAIKVDREERPDIDQLYMSYCQATTGNGGWPLSIFMTWDQKPFYAGTYFPKRSMAGHLGFMELLAAIADKWEHARSSVEESALMTVEALKRQESASFKRELQKWVVRSGYEKLKAQFDPINGGFSKAPKFPSPQNIMFLLAYYKATDEVQALNMAEKTLQQMHRGGIYDHVGGGFSRYSVDARWLVPHFEKMLYDNALLIMAYAEAYQLTGKTEYQTVLKETTNYVLREMRHPMGGFYSAQDADSEGEEGLFYLWKPEELKALLGDRDANAFMKKYDVTGKGNFEGRNILNLLNAQSKDRDAGDGAGRDEKGSERDEKGEAAKGDESDDSLIRAQLYDARQKRIAPGTDDKVLTAWNGMMIAALCKASNALGLSEYLEVAREAATFMESSLMSSDGRLFARYRNGESKYTGLLEDYAYMVWAYIELYESTCELPYLERAQKLQQVLDDQFIDEEHGAYYISSVRDQELVVRSKVFYDGASPSGNSVCAHNLIRLSGFLSREAYRNQAERIVESFGRILDEMPTAAMHLLHAKLRLDQPRREIVLAGERSEAVLNQMDKRMRAAYRPFDISMWSVPGEPMDGFNLQAAAKKPVCGSGAAYICENFTCSAPITTMEEFEAKMKL